MPELPCERVDGGLILPIFGEAELEWNNALRIILYLCGLLWSFTGVAIIADVFMSAIERITSVKKRIRNRSSGRMTTVNTWNPTVANLTLMALGSSAPEILLSFIELLQNNMLPGELGPSTIVGSAAFNLLVITAVCVSALPKDEVRIIKDGAVYLVTVVFSLWAYLWLIVILKLTSPNVVTITEGVLSFLFFPLLLIIAYAADRGVFSNRDHIDEVRINAGDLTKEELSEKAAEIRRMHGDTISDDAVLKLVEECTKAQPSRATYRVKATRGMTGRGKKQGGAHHTSEVVSAVATTTDEIPNIQNLIEFQSSHYAVLENIGTMRVRVNRSGDVGFAVSADYKTRAGTALPGQDFVHSEGTITFEPDETEKVIEIDIVDDAEFEENEEFYLDLSNVQVHNSKARAQLGAISASTIAIIDDDQPGILLWDEDFVEVKEDIRDVSCSFVVDRKCGSTGTVQCEWIAEDATAIRPLDFVADGGMLTFETGQLQAKVNVLIKARGRYENTEEFRLVLRNPTNGASFDLNTDGGKDLCIKTVRIVADKQNRDAVDKLNLKLLVNMDKYKLGTSNWREQFISAWYCNGSAADQKDASVVDWILHLLTVPWKLLFAFVPPTDYANGWVCFCVALLFIAVLTALVGDLATFFGCVVGMKPGITAITFVALGTSLPDLFASKTAACQSETADAAICNITGSNSVNVFLGLGLPWGIGAIYWGVGGPNAIWRERFTGRTDLGLAAGEAAFVVDSGSLVFSVIVFSCCAIACIAILAVRRVVAGGELGGANHLKWMTSAVFVFLWLLYVLLSVFKEEKLI